MQYDAAIIGGSLAGSTAAILLAKKGQRVLMLDQAAFPRDKVCGEFLSPASRNLLQELQLEDRLIASGAQKIDHVEVAVDSQHHFFKLQNGPALSISRRSLDQIFQEEAIRQGCEVRNQFECLQIKEGSPSKLFIRSKLNGLESSVETPCVINASGSFNRFSKDSIKPSLKKVGFKAHFSSQLKSSAVQLYFFDGGYLGICQVENNLTNLCGWLDAKRAKHYGQNFDLLLLEVAKQNKFFAQWLHQSQRKGEWIFTGHIALGLTEKATPWFSIGDAFGFVEPFLGQGMTMAIFSGFKVSQFLKSGSKESKKFSRMMKSQYLKRQIYSNIFHWLTLYPPLFKKSLRYAPWFWDLSIRSVCSPKKF